MKRAVAALLALAIGAGTPLWASAAGQGTADAGSQTAPLERRVLFLGDQELANWRKADPGFFTAPLFRNAGGFDLGGRKQLDLATLIAGHRPHVIYFLADRLSNAGNAVDRAKEQVTLLLQTARAQGAVVILARAVAYGGTSAAADDALAAWMQQLAQDGQAIYSDPNRIDFHPDLRLKKPADLAMSTNGIRGALDSAFRFTPGIPAEQQFGRLMQAFEATPYDEGSGPFRAVAGIDPALPTHSFYRPANLPLFEKQRLPVLIFGNGGCADDAANARPLLTEIASHGYLVITLGQLKSGPGGLAAYPDLLKLDNPPPGRGTSAADMKAAIDWVEKVAASKEGWGRYVDAGRIAVSGWSCGGLQALANSPDPRVKATIIFNSGLFGADSPGMPGMDVSKSTLDQLHAPILYLLGGPTDVAYGNGTDDFSRISKVPAYLLSREVGHSGTFWQPHGGVWAQAARLWLDWRLKGDAKAAAAFDGKDCGLCADPSWTIKRRGPADAR